MIIEILQLFDTLTNGNIHLLVIFFIIFMVAPLSLIRTNSREYNNRYDVNNRVYTNDSSSLNVTVIVPLHIEDYDTFDNCLNSIYKQRPSQLIVSIDSEDQKLIDIANKYKAEILRHGKRVGKRRSLADAWIKAKNDIIIHIDSDTILYNNCLEEIVKPFNDSQIAGIASSHTCTPNGSSISYILSSSIEMARDINDRALNGNLVVVDGKCNAWRRSFLLSIRDKFLTEYWMGVKCEIGDDRFLSREALKQGFKTVYNESAKIYSSAPNSFTNFLKQQIRWRRSGTKFWIKDLKEGVCPTKLYIYKCATYYTAPFIFPLVIMFDTLFFKLQFDWNFMGGSMILIVIGTTLITIVGQTIYFGRVLFPKYVILQGLIGLFIMLPISIYGSLTINRQDSWMTR